MAFDRSAHNTIAGYHYQFDKSILTILQSKPKSPVVLEGVEDVDVEGQCIQVKYHASQKYTPSKIKKPILAFLEHYRNRKTSGTSRYRLYAHFGDMSSFADIDLSGLKTILGSDKKKLRLSDAELQTFLNDHFAYEAADDIHGQKKTVLLELGRVLAASSADCEQYYYCNALHEVFRLARQPTPSERTITHAAFVKAINKKSQIFARWLAEMRGQKKYTKYIQETLKATDALRTTKARFVYLASSLLKSESNGKIAAFCQTLADRFYELGKVLYNAKPITVVIERSRDEVLDVQRELLRNGVRLNTGYEAIEFQPAMFNEPPIINRKKPKGGKATEKVATASFRIGVIAADTYTAHRMKIDAPESLIICGDTGSTTFEPPVVSQTFRIADVKNLKELSGILSK